ncbi:hypothetical protein N7509_006726 [Penicillium cosmopolitanum]|uniref:Uncharacterized protein n=1 Tax=Penicillium cosmopolitanum TaxID=1131564 RepID=A0A9X0B7Q9_9EURO|nr:uncharacterized protein N7509_006726 [Penicillium cosmopolitanum]KAJ5391236.1 hypothetical protein N7509_006726 [Penicillium cosmopolitanum]
MMFSRKEKQKNLHFRYSRKYNPSSGRYNREVLKYKGKQLERWKIVTLVTRDYALRAASQQEERLQHKVKALQKASKIKDLEAQVQAKQASEELNETQKLLFDKD